MPIRKYIRRVDPNWKPPRKSQPLAEVKVEPKEPPRQLTCSVDGCEQPVNCKGLCKHHYSLDRLTKNPELRDKDLAKRKRAWNEKRALARIHSRSQCAPSSWEIRRHLAHGRTTTDIAMRLGIHVSAAKVLVDKYRIKE